MAVVLEGILGVKSKQMGEASTIGKLKEFGCRSEHLDILVQDEKMQAANLINTAGMEAQVKYLLTKMTAEEILDTVKHEFEMLRRYHMKCQSKLPDGNVRSKK